MKQRNLLYYAYHSKSENQLIVKSLGSGFTLYLKSCDTDDKHYILADDHETAVVEWYGS